MEYRYTVKELTSSNFPWARANVYGNVIPNTIAGTKEFRQRVIQVRVKDGQPEGRTMAGKWVGFDFFSN